MHVFSCQHLLPPGHQNLCLRPSHVSQLTVTSTCFGPTGTCLHPQHLFSPTSTRFQLRTPPFHPPKPCFRPLSAFLTHHGSFWTYQDPFTPPATSLDPPAPTSIPSTPTNEANAGTYSLRVLLFALYFSSSHWYALLALYISHICLFAAPLSRLRGKEVSFRTLRIQVPFLYIVLYFIDLYVQ